MPVWPGPALSFTRRTQEDFDFLAVKFGNGQTNKAPEIPLGDAAMGTSRQRGGVGVVMVAAATMALLLAAVTVFSFSPRGQVLRGIGWGGMRERSALAQI